MSLVLMVKVQFLGASTPGIEFSWFVHSPVGLFIRRPQLSLYYGAYFQPLNQHSWATA